MSSVCTQVVTSRWMAAWRKHLAAVELDVMWCRNALLWVDFLQNYYILCMFCVVFVGITVSHPLFEAGVWAFLYPLLCELLAGLLFSNAIKYTRLLVSFHLCNLLGRAAQPVLQECGSSELCVWRWRLTSHSCFIYQRLNSSRIELQHNVQKGDFVSEPFSNVLSVWK